MTLTSHYRVLEQRGRKDHRAGEGLSPAQSATCHTIVHKMLGQAVKDGLLLRNRPTPRRRRAPGRRRRRRCTRGTPRNSPRSCGGTEGSSQNYPLWHTLAMTGMRRGEELTLRCRDADLDAATVSVRRSAGMARNAGEGAGVVEGDTKSGKPRVVDLDDEAIAVLRAWKRDRGAMALQLVTPGSLMFGDIEGGHRNPEHVSRQFARDVGRCGQMPAVRLHDLRHYADGWVMWPAGVFALLGAAELVLQSA